MYTEPPVDCVKLNASMRPEHPALVELDTGYTLTYAGLHRRVAQAVTVLIHDFAIDVGDRVAILSRNRADYAVLHLACARIGAILVALNWRLTGPELAGLIEDAEPKVLFGDASLDLLPAESVAGMPVENMESLAGRIDWAEPDWREGVDSDLPSLMLFTSGTSGRPKGALLSERNLFTSAVSFTVIGQVKPESVFLCDSPMFHVLGLVSNFRPPMMMGSTVLISSGFDPARTLGRMADPALGVTHYFCVPQMAEMLRTVPGFDPAMLRGLVALITGGAPNPAAKIREWLADGIPVTNGYGMTETGALLGMPADIALIEKKIESAGCAVPLVEVRITAEDGSRCVTGEVGEIMLRGPGITKGYWRRPEANEASFTPDGWFHTGDMGRVDADGYYYLVDRKKDMYISGGENVYPAEVEAALLALTGLSEAAVVGVPDEKWGEVGFAALVPRPGVTLDEAAVRAHLDSCLARYKIPRHFMFLDALPRTGSGKVVKAEIRKLFAG